MARNIQSGRKGAALAETESEADDRALPPRRIVHPTEKGIWTKRFYNTLLILFISLILFIIFWFQWFRVI